LRRKLSGTSERPRLAVFRSNEHIYAQIIDDTKSHTLATASTLTKDLKEVIKDIAGTEAGAALVGKKIAELAKAHGIEKVAFDRGGFAYHGRVKALADAAREGGLVF
jgi:large subunit ribosomal protein L18